MHFCTLFCCSSLKITFYAIVFQGKPIKVVADNLAISEATVVFHLRNIRQKLNATTVEQALFLFGVAMSGTESPGDVTQSKSSFFNMPSYD